MNRLVIIRLSKEGRVFQNTECQGIYTLSNVEEELRRIHATDDDIIHYRDWVVDKYRERITIETCSNTQMWFAYIIK